MIGKWWGASLCYSCSRDERVRARDKVQEACTKLDASFRRDPHAVGIQLNLGLCAQDAGRIATAARLFEEARDRATDEAMVGSRNAAKLSTVDPRTS